MAKKNEGIAAAPAAEAKKDYKYVRKSFRYDGKLYSVRGKTEDEAEEKKAELKDKLKKGVPVKQNASPEKRKINEGMTVNEFAELWLETFVDIKVRESGKAKQKNTMSEKTYNMYVQQLNIHILPVIGKERIKEVDEFELQRILNSQKKKGLSWSTSVKTRMVLNAMFKQAAKSRIIPFNVADDLIVTCEQGTERRSLTDFEKGILLKAADEYWNGFWFVFLMNTGLRPAESAALQVKDIDFDKKMIKVYKAIESGTEKVIGTPKTKAGDRKVPINSAIYDGLLKAVEGKAPDEFVFTQKDGKTMMTSTSMTKSWQAFFRVMEKAAGAKTKYGHPIEHPLADDLCLYCLRHTYGSDLQRAGISINEAKKLMGHEDITTTANIYTHSDEDDIIRIGDRIDSYLAEMETRKTAY